MKGHCLVSEHFCLVVKPISFATLSSTWLGFHFSCVSRQVRSRVNNCLCGASLIPPATHFNNNYFFSDAVKIYIFQGQGEGFVADLAMLIHQSTLNQTSHSCGSPPSSTLERSHQTCLIQFYIILKVNFQTPVDNRVFQKNTFFKKEISATHHASAWRLVWRNPKGFLISTKFKGSLGHFCFDLFYDVDFHSALTWPGWEWAEWKSTM